MGFRPLAGFWFLNKISITERDIAGAVSVPLRGSPILDSPVTTGEVASNASRWGRLCLVCTSDAMEGLQLAFMAPPPPLTRSPSPALAGEAGGTLRPLAGFPYLSFPRHYGGSGEQREPMGALVPCVHF